MHRQALLILCVHAREKKTPKLVFCPIKKWKLRFRNGKPNMHLHTSQGAPKKTHTHTQKHHRYPPVITCLTFMSIYKSSSFIQNLTKYNDISVKCRTPSLSKERCTSWPSIQATPLVSSTCGESRWRSPLPKGGLVRGHDKPIHGSFSIYFPCGIIYLT